MLIGYKKVLEDDKSQRKQTLALKQAGCKQISRIDTESGLRLNEFKRGDTLVVWRLDVLTDSLKALVELVREMHGRKLNLHSLSEPYKFNAKNSVDMLQVLTAISDFQSNLIKNRTLHGLREARALGHFGGRPRKMGMAQVKRARAMLKRPNMTKSRVAKEFGICRVTLNKALERE